MANQVEFDGDVLADGVRLRMRVSGTGPTLLLANGIGAAMAGWSPIEPWLRRYRTVRFDAPGVGGSPTPRVPMTMRRVARAVHAGLGQLGITHTDVLGVSLGGAVAQELARLAPDTVRRLVLVSTSCGLGSPPLRPGPALALLRVDRFRRPQVYERLAADLLGGRARDDREFRRAYVAARGNEPVDPVGYLWQLTAAGCWTSLPWLHRIRQPTIVLVGSDDPLTPVTTARLLASRLPSAELHVIPGAGHLLLFEAPDLAMRHIDRFLADPNPTLDTGGTP